MRGNSTISNRCRCHRTAAVDHRTSCRWRPPYAVVEAAKYFQIGESNIRRLTREHKDKDFVLWKDRRVYIRRKEMESFLDTINEI